MKKRSPFVLGLALACALCSPLMAHAADDAAPAPAAAAAPAAPAATATMVKKKTAKKPAPHKAAAHKAAKSEIAHKTAAKKTASKTGSKAITAKATAKKSAAHVAAAKKAAPVLLAAVPAAPTVNAPSMATPVAAHPRSMAHMAKPPGKTASAGAPKQVVQHFYDDLLGAMKQADALGFNGRAEKMQALLDQNFNANEMMQTAAGPSWGAASPTQKQQMVSSFRTFTAATYASRFSHYAGEQFQIVDEKPGRNANETVVETQLVEGSGERTDLNYLLRRDGGGWKIVDVYVDGTISEMAARRSEFGSVLRRDGVDALLKLMDEKSRSLASS